MHLPGTGQGRRSTSPRLAQAPEVVAPAVVEKGALHVSSACNGIPLVVAVRQMDDLAPFDQLNPNASWSLT